MIKVERVAAKIAGTGAALGGAFKLVVDVEGRPIKDKDKPARVRFAGLTVFERDESGRQHVLWFRIRDVRR